MRVLLVHRYFWPDSPPYASMLRSIGSDLSLSGNEVHVLTAQPSYGGSSLHPKRLSREVVDGVVVTRLRLLTEEKAQWVRRTFNLVLFAAQVFLRIVTRRRYDVVMAATTPPIFVALAALTASRIKGAAFVYHMQDVYPEVLAPRGKLPVWARVLKSLDSVTTRHADEVVVLSRDMARTVAARSASGRLPVAINNFLPDGSHSASVTSAVRTRFGSAGSFQIVFAGGLGRFQALVELVEAVVDLDRLTSLDVCLVLVGDGPERTSLEVASGDLLDEKIFFTGRVSQYEAESVVAASDLALVTLKEGLIDCAFPSKTMTYLATGTPVLATVDSGSELASVLSELSAGAVCEGTRDGLASAIREMVRAGPVNREALKKRTHGFASRNQRLQDWRALFEEVSGA